MENKCLFCLESGCKIIKRSSCSCRIIAHELCWEAYEIRKGIIECPICHLKTKISPLEIAIKNNLREKIIVEMKNNDETGFHKCMICCCLGCFCGCGILAAVFG